MCNFSHYIKFRIESIVLKMDKAALSTPDDFRVLAERFGIDLSDPAVAASIEAQFHDWELDEMTFRSNKYQKPRPPTAFFEELTGIPLSMKTF